MATATEGAFPGERAGNAPAWRRGRNHGDLRREVVGVWRNGDGGEGQNDWDGKRN